MADYQRVVETLRDLRQGPLQSVSEEISQVAADYAALCAQANERLRQCSAFLQQGLRTEAIHLAEESPNLLDLVAALDLPDPAPWAEFCNNNGLAVAPPLQLERAAQLNEAYAQDQPLEHLLAQHRLLALARAPARERLEVLRKVGELDAGGAWEKDLRMLERARLRELPAAFYAAVKNRDDAAIAALREEIHGRTWLETVPGDLAAAVADAHGRMKRASVEVELQALVEPLREAYAVRSLQECQALAQRWKRAMEAAGVNSVSSTLTDEIKPVLAWITEQTRRQEYLRRFKESCRTFARLLDQDAPDAQLEAGYARLKEFREEIPDDLTQRYLAKKAVRGTTAERSHKVRLMVIAAVALVVLAIGFFVAVLVVQSTAAQRHAQRIADLLAKHTRADLDSAQTYVDGLRRDNPAVLKEPKVAAAVADLAAQQAAYQRDQTALEAWFGRAEQARQTAAATGSANPSLAEVAQAVTALQSALETARSNAGLQWVDAAHRLPAALQDLQNDLAAVKTRGAALVRRELEGLSARLDGLATTGTSPDVLSDALTQAAAIGQRLNELRDVPGLDDETRTAINSVGLKLGQKRHAIEATLGVADDLARLGQQATSAEALRTALAAFVQKYPRDPRSADFARAAAALSQAAALEAWHDLVATFNGEFVPAGAAAVQKRLQAVTAYLAGAPDSAAAGLADQYADYLRRANEALSDKGTWQSGLADLVAEPLLAELAYMEVSDGRRYYVLGDPHRKERKINTQVSITFDTLNPRDLTKRLTITIDPPYTVSEAPLPAPHARFVNELAASLMLINDKNWETFGIDLADQLVRNDQMELVVKAILLQRVLKIQDAVTGWALGDFYGQVESDLERQSPADLPWIDSRQITAATRAALRTTLDSLPSSTTAKQRLAEAKARLFKAAAFDLAGAGVLLKDDQTWSVATRTAPPSGSRLWTVLPPPAAPRPATTSAGTAPTAPAAPPTPAQLLPIGTYSGGKFILDEAALRTVPQGSIVYMTKP